MHQESVHLCCGNIHFDREKTGECIVQRVYIIFKHILSFTVRIHI